MMAARKLLRRLRASQAGATIVEFAVVSSVFFLMLMGIMEYGMIMMTKVAVESIAQELSRSSSVGAAIAADTSTGFAGCAAGNYQCIVVRIATEKGKGLLNPANLQVTATKIASSGTPSPKIPDVCLYTVGVPNPANCGGSFLDNDGVSGYQQTTVVSSAGLGTNTLGATGELVEIRISYAWQILFPIMKPFFNDNKGAINLSSTTVIRNE